MNLDQFKGFDYNSEEADEEIMLSELPLSMIKDSIRQQFSDPITYGKNDFVQTFETRYTITKENMDEENEEEITQLYDQFMSFMRDIFKEKLSIGFPYLEDMPEQEQLELIHYTYRFFVINLKQNYLTFAYNYILQHKKELAEMLPKKKDVTTNSLREVVDDEDDITIVAGITKCMEYILHNKDISIDEFMELSRGDGPNLENDFINEKYDDFNINGNFILHYADMLDDITQVEIESQIRNKILSKYRKKKPVEKPEETPDTPTSEI
jgi:hypothetical protein